MSLTKFKLESLKDKHDALTNAELEKEVKKLKSETKEDTKGRKKKATT